MYCVFLFVEASKPASPRFAEIGKSGTSLRMRNFPAAHFYDARGAFELERRVV